jgi:hypothetical protein
LSRDLYPASAPFKAPAQVLIRLQDRAVTIVREHRAKVAAIAEALVSRRFLSADDIAAVVTDLNAPVDDEFRADAPGRPS